MSGSTATPRAVLVDGYNVLHAIARFAPRGGPVEPARTAFQAWLAEAARRRGVREVVVVWDGRTAGREPRAPAPLKVLFTPKGTTADDRILDLCRGTYAGRASTTWVVSSDREVQGPARQLGFEGIGAMTFYRRWARGGGGPGRSRSGSGGGSGSGSRDEPGGAKKPRRASADEVEELLDAFLREEGLEG